MNFHAQRLRKAEVAAIMCRRRRPGWQSQPDHRRLRSANRVGSTVRRRLLNVLVVVVSVALCTAAAEFLVRYLDAIADTGPDTGHLDEIALAAGRTEREFARLLIARSRVQAAASAADCALA